LRGEIVVLLAIGILAGVFIDSKLITQSAATSAIFAEHIGSLKSGHLIDVASSDKHTVKPWFAGKVDFSPFVIDLSSTGYPLLGGRAEYFDGHDAAALVYAKGHHYIELYEWPVQNQRMEATKEERGYNALFFVHGGMQCCVISDAAMEEIRGFQRQLEGALVSH
jgi:anti-sigma factor RsiW